ncbi:MAG TPA: bifunctional oligoribonuclease/PAP phosphatase NrnA [Phycisphaerae bacterium]|nr:bifunctional oligoribonuclease/PAP phosphatase NrnA [Phycisphaerae bacterium]
MTTANQKKTPGSPTSDIEYNGEPPAEFVETLRDVRRPLIVAHVTPDADAVGGMLGMATAMREHGIEAVVGLPTATLASKLRFMVDLVPQTPLAEQWSADGRYDSAIVLDTASEKRINIRPPLDLAGPLPIFNIDHHITNTDFGTHNWVVPHATSTSEMVARLIVGMGWPLSTAVASLLYAGIHGDTAGFSLPSTSADSLRIAAGLVQAGADVGHIGEQLCRSQNRSDFELLRRVYDHTKVVEDGLIAYSHLSHQDIAGAGCKADDIDDQVSIPRALKGVRIALLFSEGEPGVIRVNLRGEGRVTVVEIAKKFGGGGHAQAAGIRFYDKTMDEAIREVIATASEKLRASDAQ